MIDPATFKALLRRSRVRRDHFANAIERESAVIGEWMNGKAPIPQYISLTIEGVERRLDPAPDDTMLGADLVHGLGIEKSVEHYWKTTRQFPTAARFAVAAWLSHTVDAMKLSSYETQTLRKIGAAGRYYRTTGGWRARGYPKLNRETPSRLVRLGLLREVWSPNHCIELTPIGRDRITNG